MASNVIIIGGTSSIAGQVQSCHDSLQASVNQVRSIAALMAQFNSDWVALQAQLGVASPEDAQTIYGNFVNALSVLNGADIAYFLNRLAKS
jgi:hypothetical protein